jgi:hypothetical protein
MCYNKYNKERKGQIKMFEQYNGEMSIREWIEAHPNCTIDTDVAEGYGDGWFNLNDVLDETEFRVWYNDNYAEFSI